MYKAGQHSDSNGPLMWVWLHSCILYSSEASLCQHARWPLYFPIDTMLAIWLLNSRSQSSHVLIFYVAETHYNGTQSMGTSFILDTHWLWSSLALLLIWVHLCSHEHFCPSHVSTIDRVLCVSIHHYTHFPGYAGCTCTSVFSCVWPGACSE